MADTKLTDTKIKENLRAHYMGAIKTALEAMGETVYVTGSNSLHFLCEADETARFQMKLTFTIPSGQRGTGDIDNPADLAEEYARNCAEKAEKAREAERKKAQKIARDEAARKAKAEAKAKALSEEEGV